MSFATFDSMTIPQRFLKLLAREAPKRFEDLDQLTYLAAVALASGPIEDPRLDAYVRYFKAEQEDDQKQMQLILAQCERDQNQEPAAQVLGLIRGRRLLQKPLLSTSEVESWLNESIGLFGSELQGYLYFLAGIGCLQANDQAKSSHFLNKSASEFHKVGKSSRELQSILQDPTLKSDELRYLRSHALKAGDLKAYHIAGLSLATVAERIGDLESVRQHTHEAIRAFREEFLDPRRERISEALLSSSEHLKQNFTMMERRLIKLLEKGPRSKADLISEAYGRLSNYACKKSIDSRFRTLLSRLNKKMNGLIIHREGTYQIKCD